MNFGIQQYDGDPYNNKEPMDTFWTGEDIGVSLTLEWGHDHPHLDDLKFEYTIDVWASDFGGFFYTWTIYIDDLPVSDGQPYSDSCILAREEYSTIDATIMVYGQSPTCLVIHVDYEVFDWQIDHWQDLNIGEDYEYWWVDPLV